MLFKNLFSYLRKLIAQQRSDFETLGLSVVNGKLCIRHEVEVEE